MNQDYLEHHGTLGQKWGVRRYQNEDGTLTPAGRIRYAKQLNKTLNKTSKAATIEKAKAMRNEVKSEAAAKRGNTKKAEKYREKAAKHHDQAGKHILNEMTTFLDNAKDYKMDSELVTINANKGKTYLAAALGGPLGVITMNTVENRTYKDKYVDNGVNQRPSQMQTLKWDVKPR